MLNKLLITGGCGFIGINFIKFLLANPNFKGHIINLDSLTYASNKAALQAEEKHQRYKFIQGSVTDTFLLQTLLKNEKIEAVVHFAAESHVDNSISNAEPFVHTNIVGTHCLLQAIKSVSNDTGKKIRLHHISTDEVFGSLPLPQKATETTTYNPSSPYSASKASADLLVMAYHRTYGLPMTLSRCSNNYGPYQHTEKLIPTVINAFKNGGVVPVYGDGLQSRDWLNVADHCKALYVILHHGKIGHTYNIGANNEWKNIDLIHLICNLMAEMGYAKADTLKQQIKHTTDRLGHDMRYALDSTKIEQDLRWHPTVNFKAGLKEVITYQLTKNRGL